ncbi:hypothetical protein PanWU01x14_047690, partial [Parasponia andersonii]
KSCATKKLPADLKNDRTMGITSLVDDLRKRTKREELRNQKLANRPQKRSYYKDHVACQRPEKTYEEERAAQPKTCQQTSKMIVLWESHRAIKCLPMAEKTYEEGGTVQPKLAIRPRK